MGKNNNLSLGFTDSQRYIFYGFLALLLFPALLINLGLMPLINDEAIRGLVALEMELSGNYITPTLNGEYYYNKPPLYNWFLLISFWLTGEASEFTLRLPTLFFLLAYAATIFYYVRQHFSNQIALICAFVFLTCGRILFWDSLLGLIDICFSWVMFLLFMTVFHRFQKRQFWQLFLITYTLTAIGFMLKGLPAIVFQAITILTWFIYKKEWKQLFKPANFAGLGLFFLIIGSYYLTYHQYNSLENVFTTLFTESSKRTVVNYGIGNTILHLFTFPFEMIYHFLPWSLLIIYFLKKGVLRWILQDDFITFCLVIFLANIIIYWTSPEVYPRYLLMLVPLLFIVFVYLHQFHQAERTWQYRVVQGSLFLLIGLVLISFGASFFLERLDIVEGRYWKSALLLMSAIPLVYFFYQYKNERFAAAFAILLIARIGFNWFVLPDRLANDWGSLVRESAVKSAKRTLGEPLFIYETARPEEMQSFYITAVRREILRAKSEDFNTTDYYIIDPLKSDGKLEYIKYDEVKVRHQKHRLAVAKLKE
ncbi:MAG: ArnT family glycosyltransferase [Saprospiraceae bacterium]